jgi:glycosyltransferase involved in cell wall biosynthesis
MEGFKSLVVVTRGKIPVSTSGEMKISRKTLSGMLQFHQRWSGEVILVSLGDWDNESVGIDDSWFRADELPFQVRLTTEIVSSVASLNPDVILAPHVGEFEGLLSLKIPVVFVTENSTVSWMREDLRQSSGPLNRLRITVGALRNARQRRRMAQQAAGLQCNGWPAWSAFSRYSDRTLLFYDTRMPRNKVERYLSASKQFMPDGVLRLGFSGRFAAGKGPEFVIDLDNRLSSLGVPHTLVMIGAGELEDSLKASAASTVEFLPPMDFGSEWMDWTHENIDLMVLPHVLGDPSGTFLESIGCGTPIVGFDSAALEALVRKFGLGWIVPVGDRDALSEVVQLLAQKPEMLKWRADVGLRFMENHCFEAEFDSRIAHLEEILARRSFRSGV